MVPIYSIDSSIALRVPPAAIFLDSIRACYQAFVVYCFLFYLLHYLSEHYDLDVHLASKPQMKSPKPFCCFKPGPNSKLVYRCRNGVLNFVIIGPLTTVTAILFYYLGDGYETGNFTTTGAWFWLTLISAISQIWAMYCLVIFYQATSEETAPLRPLPQMLCVKFAIFGSFFQQIIISLLVNLIYTCINKNTTDQTMASAAPPECLLSKSEMASEIHNFCIGIEMAIVSVVHLYAYSHKPYKDAGEPLTFRLSCRRICDYSDMKDDIRVHSGRFIQSIKKRGKGKDKEDKEETYQDGDTAMKVISMKDSTDEEMETSSGSEGPDDPGQATGYSNDESSHEQDGGTIKNPGLAYSSEIQDERLPSCSDTVPIIDHSMQLATQLQAFASDGAQPSYQEGPISGRENEHCQVDVQPAPIAIDTDDFGMSKSFQKSDELFPSNLVGNEIGTYNTLTNSPEADLLRESLPNCQFQDLSLKPSTIVETQNDWINQPIIGGTLNVVIDEFDQVTGKDVQSTPGTTNDISSQVTGLTNHNIGQPTATEVANETNGFDDDFLPSSFEVTNGDAESVRSTYPDMIEGFDDAFATDC
ncbi:uncharacterized protein [Apostichopus japonicus]